MSGSPCAVVGCPNLKPCPTHPGRPRNAPWSRDRDGLKQYHERKAALVRAGYTCERCGHHDPTGRTLEAHHVTPTQVMLLCNPHANGCHRAVDAHAR